MAQVIVTESYLENIGDAIRSKLGGTDTYTPAEMAGAISQIHGDPVLEALSVTENGTYNPSSGKDGFSQAVVNVPNTYAAGDEGKVVSNGALVAQTSDTVTENDTYDTTLINQLTVNVSGGGGDTKTFLYQFDQTQGQRWINTEVDVSSMDYLYFEDIQSNVIKTAVIKEKNTIAVYTGGADVYTTIFSQNGKSMNARIYNNYLYVSYNYIGTADYVTKVYNYIYNN